MDKEELIKLIAKGENFHTEFKESYSSDVAKEICAFANAGPRTALDLDQIQARTAR